MPQAAIPAVVAGGAAAFAAGTIFTATVYTAFFSTLALGLLPQFFANRGAQRLGGSRGAGGGTVGGARNPAAERIIFGRWRARGDVAWFDESETILRMGIALSAGEIERVDEIWSSEHDERVPVKRGRLAYDHWLGDDPAATRVPNELRTDASPPGLGPTNPDGTPSFDVLDSWVANPTFSSQQIVISDTRYKQDLISYRLQVLLQLLTALNPDDILRLLAELDEDEVSVDGDPLGLGEGEDDDDEGDTSSPPDSPVDLSFDFGPEGIQGAIDNIQDVFNFGLRDALAVLDHVDDAVNAHRDEAGLLAYDSFVQSYNDLARVNPEAAAALLGEQGQHSAHFNANVLPGSSIAVAVDAAHAFADAINTHADLAGLGTPSPSLNAADVLAHHDLAASFGQQDDGDADGDGDADPGNSPGEGNNPGVGIDF